MESSPVPYTRIQASESSQHNQDILVSVLIVNYNGKTHLPRVLEKLRAQSLLEFELILIDNGSQDGSLDWAKDYCQAQGINSLIVENQQNLGFAPACNQGIQLARGEWIAMLNNDAFPEPTWLESLVAAVRHEPGIGMAAAKLLFDHDPSRINSAGIAIDWAGIAWDWRGGELDQRDETQRVEIFGPCGGAALYSMAMLREIGGFDDDFFAYLEDVDLAWRAQLAGWRCVFVPQARVYHVHSATLGDGSAYKNYLLGRNKIWLIVKNFPSPHLYWSLPIIVLYDLMSAVYNTWRTQNLSPIRGRLAGLWRLPRFLGKRRTIQNQWRNHKQWQRHVFALDMPLRVTKRYAHLS